MALNAPSRPEHDEQQEIRPPERKRDAVPEERERHGDGDDRIGPGVARALDEHIRVEAALLSVGETDQHQGDVVRGDRIEGHLEARRLFLRHEDVALTPGDDNRGGEIEWKRQALPGRTPPPTETGWCRRRTR